MSQQICALVESLETRRLFAGNVTVSYNAWADTYFVSGDANNNELKVDMPAPGANYVITGLTGTTINGAGSVTVPAGKGGHSGFEINLWEGNDTVYINPGTYDWMQISTHTGHDRVRMKAATIDGDLNIYTGDGDDTIDLVAGVKVVDDITVHCGAGNDRVDIGLSTWAMDDVLLDGSTGSDTLAGSFKVVGGSKTVNNFETFLP
jgi:hypothetical protein